MSEAADAHPEAGAIQSGEAASDTSGMTPDDAASSAYDDWDRGAHGIAEGEHREMGMCLKSHADSAGVTVRDGLNSLLVPAIALRHGNMADKRQVIDGLIDDYSVSALPEAEAAPAAAEYEQPIATEEQAEAAIQTFTRANPLAGDPQVLAAMVDVAGDMRRQGYQPSIQEVYAHAVSADPRFAPQVRQAQAEQATQRREAEYHRQAADPERVARAKQGNVQVSGGGRSAQSSSGVSDDLDDIFREQFGR